MKRSERVAGFVESVWYWYGQNKRILPWRDLSISDETERAYQVMISEIMLQQTQVSRVKIVFKDFLQRFPKLHDLAHASNKEVILAWRGMGYNSRALRLRDAAAAIDRLGSFPKEMDELRAIPGIGHYTAAAIRNFAFNLPTPCLDTNIRRILHRTFVGPESGDVWNKDDRFLLSIAADVLDRAIDGINDHDARNWHAALMDYGSLVQIKTNPKWDLCILTKRGLMKATPKLWRAKQKQQTQEQASLPAEKQSKKQEPGRYVGSKYIPNRIFRGKVIEELRDAPTGLPLGTIGKRICIDWSPKEHQRWLSEIVEKLQRDRLLAQKGSKFMLTE